jgi:hypothetical protein
VAAWWTDGQWPNKVASWWGGILADQQVVAWWSDCLVGQQGKHTLKNNTFHVKDDTYVCLK